MSELAWYDIEASGVEGKAFNDTVAPFDRLPGRAEGVVRDIVWQLSRESTGLSFRFETDATELHARWVLGSGELATTTQPALGKSGIDVYAWDAFVRMWRWAGAPLDVTTQEPQGLIASDMDPGTRTYIAYLPLRNSVSQIEIGVNADAKFKLIRPRDQAPIVFYGTSIVHGANASRAGMVHTAILSRLFDVPVVNLGFSGNALMEPELAPYIAEAGASVYVIDPLPNMQAPQIQKNAEHFIRVLREANPTTPIVMVEDRTYTTAWFKPGLRDRHSNSRAAFSAVFDKLTKEGDRRLLYVKGDYLLGDDCEATMDSSHPSDLGFYRMAQALMPTLRTAMGMARETN